MFDLGFGTPDGKWATRPSTGFVLGTCVVTELDSVVTSPPSKQQLTSAAPPQHSALRVHFNEEGLTLTTSSVLGIGGFGTVYAAKTPSGASFALKVSSKPLNENDLSRLRDEVRVMTAFADHPNIVRIHCAALCGDKAYIAMERCMAKNLNDVLMSRPLRTDEFKWIGYQLVETVAAMHHAKYIHRDIKPQNLLFDKDGNLKITDFGLSSKLAAGAAPRKTVAGTQLFMAPEIAAHYKRTMEAREQGVPLRVKLAYGAEIDVWSLGIVFFIMATRKSPYQHHRSGGENEGEWAKRVVDVIAGADWEWPESSGPIDPAVRDLVERVLDRDREHRPTIDSILKHPVWNDRPLTCPLSLMASLSLLQGFGSPPAKLRSLGPNTPSAKRTVEEVVDAGLGRIQSAEAVRRADIEVEWTAFVVALDGLEALHREQVVLREEIVSSEAAARVRLTAAATRKTRVTASAAPSRASSVALATKPKEDLDALYGTIVSTSSETVDVRYTGRETSTRWNLRPVISVPREVVELPTADKCLNNHILRKITELEKGVDYYDCDVCGSTLRTLSHAHAILRCRRCDYDVCTTCAETPVANRKMARFECRSCFKRFISKDKLNRHAGDCRGPSASPGRASLDSAMSAEAFLGGGKAAAGRSSVTDSSAGRPSRNSVASSRPSTGGRISIGSSVDSVEETSPVGAPRPRPSILKTRVQPLAEGESTGRLSVYERPKEPLLAAVPPARPYKPVALVDEDASPPSGSRRGPSSNNGSTDPRRSAVTPVHGQQPARSGSVVGGPGGAARSATPGGPGSRAPSTSSKVHVEIRSTAADRLPEVRKAAPSPAANGAKRSASRPQQQVTFDPSDVPLSASERRRLAGLAPAEPMQEPSRGPSKRPLAGDSPMQPYRQQPPPPRASSPLLATSNSARPYRPGSTALPQPPRAAEPVYAPPPPLPPVAPPRGGQRLSGGTNAFINIPQESRARENFLDAFFSGGWVRHYAFANNDAAALYYCLQPGRFGAMFIDAQLKVMSTAVLDIHSNLVLYVRDLASDMPRREPHPHVATAYNDDVRIITVPEALSVIGGVIRGITTYVEETRRAVAQGHAAFYITAPYVHRKDQDVVARDTKFSYLRKAFPDPDGSFCLFRLSTLRSQIIMPASPEMEVRWQSDREGRMASRYYVHADGTVKAFQNDSTGILTNVENVLMTVYHTE